MKKVKCHHRYYISFGPRWICEKCGDMKKITKKEYAQINKVE